MVVKKQYMRAHALEYLSKLKDEFQRYFPQVDATIHNLSFIKDPFSADL